MQKLIDAVDRNLIIEELTKDKFVRHTNFGQNEIYILNAHNSPNIMLEIGRLREFAFREAGGGTGKELDIDEFDTMEVPYNQLIVWNPIDQEIVGGYRFIKLRDVRPDEQGHYHLATTHMFKFHPAFIERYFKGTIELGRSFVQPRYQLTKDSRKGIFSLDNLWDGLGALIVDNPEIKYFFGKVTLYLSFDQKARDYIVHFLLKHFPDGEKLITPFHPKEIVTPRAELEEIFGNDTYDESHLKLIKAVRARNENVPPLVNAYMNLSPTMKTFGAALNPDFGDVEEIGILVSIPDIYPSKKNRHLNSYLKEIE